MLVVVCLGKERNSWGRVLGNLVWGIILLGKRFFCFGEMWREGVLGIYLFLFFEGCIFGFFRGYFRSFLVLLSVGVILFVGGKGEYDIVRRFKRRKF